MLRLKSPLESMLRQASKNIGSNTLPMRSWFRTVASNTRKPHFEAEVRPDMDKLFESQQSIIEQSGSMTELLDLIAEDPALSAKILNAISGEPVSEIQTKRNLAWNVLVAPFLREYFKRAQSIEFHKPIFDSLFERVVSELQEATITYVITIPILNLELTTDSIHLSPTLRVRPVNSDEFEEWLNLRGTFDHPLLNIQDLLGLRAAIEFTYQHQPGNALDFHYYESLNNLIALLRIITDTDIYIAFVSQRTRGLINYPGAHESIPYSLRFQGNAAVIDQSKAERLIQYWKYFSTNEQKKFLDLPLRRWAGRAERLNDEDKLIDYWIGLEALFVPNTSQEIKFRASLRIAALIGETGEHREEIYNDMRHSYDWRSTLVHGSNPARIRNLQKKGSLEDVTTKTGNCLRIAIMKLLENDRLWNPTTIELNLLKNNR